jgi:hypothetical protein
MRLTFRLVGLMLAGVLLAGCSRGASGDKTAGTDAQTELARAQAAADAGRTRAAADGVLAAQGLVASVGKLPPPRDADDGALSPPDSDGYAELQWDGMLPKEDYALLQNAPPVVHIGNRRSKQFGTLHTVAALSGRKVKLTGYVVPLETDSAGRMTEFFFVPFYGACIHVPPPPPNMMIHVVLAQPIDTPSLWDPFWLKGILRTDVTQNSMASSAYAMQSASLSKYSDATQQNLQNAFE